MAAKPEATSQKGKDLMPGIYEKAGARIHVLEVAWPFAIYTRDGGARKVALVGALAADVATFKRRDP